MQLQGHSKAFEDAGVGIAVLTYDSPALQQKFIDKLHITFPLLSDVEATSISNLGVLDTDYSPGDSAYGIPHPGVFFVDRDGIIAGKVFITGFEKRVSAEGVLAAASAALK